MASNTSPPLTCATLPSIISTFIDTFIDFSVSGGLFLPPNPNPNPQTHFPQPTRLIAIGDLHGDLLKTKQALKLAELIDGDDRWCGGDTTVVQVGDIFDRGGDEIKILYFFEKMKREALKAGGVVITMNGNHEIMNVDGDFRYVTPEGYREFENWGMWQCVGNSMRKLCCNDVGNDVNLLGHLPDKVPKVVPLGYEDAARIRLAACRPNGLIANRFLSKNQTVVIVGDSVFAHGGLLERHVVYGLEKVNEDVRDWITGVRGKLERELVRGRNSIVWLRSFSHEVAKNCDCSMLEHVLKTIPGAKRMIMGHTIQEDGISTVCGDRAIRIDVGMSRGCGDKFPEVLEINEKSELRVLTSNPVYAKGYGGSVRANRKEGLGSLIPGERPRQVEVNA